MLKLFFFTVISEDFEEVSQEILDIIEDDMTNGTTPNEDNYSEESGAEYDSQSQSDDFPINLGSIS